MDIGETTATAHPVAGVHAESGGLLPSYTPVVLVDANPISGFGAFIKRSQDIVLSILLVLGFSWLLLGIALAIKTTSRGPVVFRQERRGRNGTTFHCFKFRSMYVEETDFDSAVQTRVNDPRITPIGRFLRKHSLDELPQLVNVIVGHMSLGGASAACTRHQPRRAAVTRSNAGLSIAVSGTPRIDRMGTSERLAWHH